MEQVVITNKKNKPLTTARTNASAVDTAYINTATTYVDVMDAITTAVHVTFTANTSNADVFLGLYDKDKTLIGTSPVANFISSTYRNAQGYYTSPRYLFDTGEAMFVYPFIAVINTGNINVKIQPLG